MSTQQQKINEIASTHLGKKGGEGYKDRYDPSLLVPIPRIYNRETYGIENEKLPFTGVDVWNAYEVSALTFRGLPVTGMLKIIYPADSEYHVESKSLKLYLNSFNMTKMGDTIEACIRNIEDRVRQDLSKILHHDAVFTTFFRDGYGTAEEEFEGYPPIQSLIPDIELMEFTAYKSDSALLEHSSINGVVRLSVDFLRSNCRVTSQPDWGKLYLYIRATDLPTIESIARYVVSHRTVSHFHEEIVEMVYKHFKDRFKPEELMVAALYTRRGGIDINPVRASHPDLIPSFITDPNVRLKKTLMQ